MAELMKQKLIIAAVLLTAVLGTVSFIAHKTTNPVFAPEIQEALKEKDATHSADQKNPSEGIVEPHRVSPAPSPVPGLLDCNLLQYGGTRTQTTEAECRNNIKILIQSQSNWSGGVHCRDTAAGCGTQQSAGTSGSIDLTLPNLGPGVDLTIPTPNYQEAVDEFNDSVKIPPVKLPCVPVGDGFNCL